MKKLATIFAIVTFIPAFAQAQNYTPLQQYLYSESGYAPPALSYEQPLTPEASSYDTAYVAPYGDEYEENESEPVIMSLEDL